MFSLNNRVLYLCHANSLSLINSCSLLYREKSIELKQSQSCLSHGTPERSPQSCLSKVHSFTEWDEYPSLNPQVFQPSSLELTSPNEMSYAQALAPRLTKRTMSDRTCLSPVDFVPKRSALSNVVKTPFNINQTYVDKPECDLDSSVVKVTPNASAMDIGITPDNDRYWLGLSNWL